MMAMVMMMSSLGLRETLESAWRVRYRRESVRGRVGHTRSSGSITLCLLEKSNGTARPGGRPARA